MKCGHRSSRTRLTVSPPEDGSSRSVEIAHVIVEIFLFQNFDSLFSQANPGLSDLCTDWLESSAWVNNLVGGSTGIVSTLLEFPYQANAQCQCTV